MTLHLKVKPGSKIDRLFYHAAGLGHVRPGHVWQLNVKIKASAQDGRANAYLVDFLAKQFGTSKSNVTIVAGFKNLHKRIEIDGDEELIQAVLETLRNSSPD